MLAKDLLRDLIFSPEKTSIFRYESIRIFMESREIPPNLVQANVN